MRRQANPQHVDSRSRRAYMLGNMLIILGIVLIGAATSIVAAKEAPTVTPPSQVAAVQPAPPASRPPWLAVVQAAGTPIPEDSSETVQETPATVQTPEPVPASSATPEVEPAATATSEPGEESSGEASAEQQPINEVPDRPVPNHVRIPSVGIDTDMVEVGYKIVEMGGQPVLQWDVAAYAAGHHNLSANPGEGGNIVITGHNDWLGEVFRPLEFVQLGAEIILTTSEGDHRYAVTEIHYRKEVGVSLEERLATGQFLADMPEERVTLITCWPYGVDDHRLIVVAKPVVS